MMDDVGLIRRQHQQHLLQVKSGSRQHHGSGGSSSNMLVTRQSSGECVSSSDDELAGETLFEAHVGVLARKKSSSSSSKGTVQFEQDASERVLQLQGDQLKLKKKDKLKEKIFVYYVWVRRNISDYVPRESHKLKDESLAVIAGWHRDVMIVTFGAASEKEAFLLAFQRVNQEKLRDLYGDQPEDLSELCLVTLGACAAVSSGQSSATATEQPQQTLSVKPYETANDVVLKCKSAFKLEPSLRTVLWLDGPTSCCMVGCESIFSTILFLIHQSHKSNSSSCGGGRRRGSVLSEASSTSPNDSNSMDLDESLARDSAPKVRMSLHLLETCASTSCTTAKKKKQHHHSQLRRTSEVPSKIRSWIASNRKSQLVRQGSVEALAASGPYSVVPSGEGSSSSSPIIGRPLAELYPSGMVSRPVTCLLAQIYQRCYLTRGIFRQPGSVSEKNQVLQLLSQYDLARADNLRQLNDFGEHCIADALKHYLRNLPGCLLQKSLASQWTRVLSDAANATTEEAAASSSSSSSPGGRSTSAEIRAIIRQMQPQNAHLLHMLMTTLRRVADHHEQNQMTATNIGTSVSFSVLDLDPQGCSLEALEQEAQRVNKLIETMIANYADIWPDEQANARVLEDFVHHASLSGDHLSSMESLFTDGAATRSGAQDVAEPLSLSSVSKDSGLQLSDQQLDDSKTKPAAASTSPVAVNIPERSQPPPYDIAMKRQARTQQRSRQPQQLQQQQSTTTTTPPRRECPPVPARMAARRPASLGPSGRRPLPAAASFAATTITTPTPQQQPPPSVSEVVSAESKSRHPLSTRSTTARDSAPMVARAPASQQHQQHPPPPPLLQRFRKRSSSETRLDLLGLGSPAASGAATSAIGSNSSAYQYHRQPHHHFQQQPQQQQQQSVAADPSRYRRQEFERLSRLHTRDSVDAFGGRQQSAVVLRHFSSRHAPIRGSLAVSPSPGGSGEGGSPRALRPRTRLPEALQLKLADQPESLV